MVSDLNIYQTVFSFSHVNADIDCCSDCALICLVLIFRDDCLWHGQRSSASALSEFGWCQQWAAIWFCCSCHFTVSGCLVVSACVVLFNYCCNLEPHRFVCSVLLTAHKRPLRPTHRERMHLDWMNKVLHKSP